jgi:aspartate carbamoyltransferase catalytic subunit
MTRAAGELAVAGWSHRHLLGCSLLSAEALRALLGRAREHVPSAWASVAERGERTLAGRTVVNLFFEDSTRTRVSFGLAARRLGALVTDLTLAGSSLSKGETLLDTARNLAAMGASAFVVRTGSSGSAAAVAEAIGTPVINAGDGRHEHPTQALLDAFTLADACGRTGFDLSGLTVAIVGDVVSSRVARSNAALLTTLGAGVVLVGPPALAPGSLSDLAPGVAVAHDFDAVLGGAHGVLDAVMMLRMQFERHKSPAIASAREYRLGYGLTAERAGALPAQTRVMHPGPMNRGFEIDSAVADGERSLIMAQARNGVAVRMAVLEACVGAAEAA